MGDPLWPWLAVRSGCGMSGSCQSSLLDPRPPEQQRGGREDPFLALSRHPLFLPPVRGLGKQNRVLGTWACPEATSLPPRPPRHLLSICPDASVRHVACGSGWTFISAPRGAHRTRIQTGVPAQGAHKLNETQQTRTHRTRTQGVGHLPGRQTVEAEGRGTAWSGIALRASPWGAGRAEAAQDGAPSPGGTRERAPGGSGPARGGKGPSVWMTRGLATWRQENEAGSPGGGPEPMVGGCPSAGELSLL